MQNGKYTSTSTTTTRILIQRFSLPKGTATAGAVPVPPAVQKAVPVLVDCGHACLFCLSACLKHNGCKSRSLKPYTELRVTQRPAALRFMGHTLSYRKLYKRGLATQLPVFFLELPALIKTPPPSPMSEVGGSLLRHRL